ncbi:hypothetical protein XA68_12849 [Ophiocordyceps unilateralis]|uniref:Cell surface protein n=1 Tax=Ophiocordyceps unilateralis TaxID=268505 RepID=A0A2A9PNY9_OPHUN|nr:hypothetical protein XA68_12849 [Ophiocordyceps unilateralis]
MSSLVNKVKEAMHSSDNTTTTTSADSHHNPSAPRTDNPATGTGHAISSHDYTSGDNYAIGGNNRGVEGHATRTDGPHSSNLANKADPRVDSDRDHSRNLGANPQGTATTGHYGTTGLTGSSGTTGTSGLESSRHTGLDTGRHTGTSTHNTKSTAGPHDSDLANKLDPRVDSDRDGSRTIGSNPQTTSTSTGHHSTSTGTTGPATSGYHGGIHDTAHTSSTTTGSDTTGLGSSGFGHQPGHTTHARDTSGVGPGAAAAAATAATHKHAGHDVTGLHSHGGNRDYDSNASRTDGPHSSNIANKADPRVDSDRDHSKNLGANPSGTATTGNTTHGNLASHGTHQRVPEGTAGPHDSRLANAADPRVDSDLDSSRNLGASGTHTGTHSTHSGTHTGVHSGTHGTHTGADTGLTGTHAGTHGTHTGTHGTHDTHTGHKTGVLGDTHSGAHSHSGTTGTTTGTHSTGPAPKTAGPHSKDILNKLDPRVDSDLDGSKTVGGNKTFDRT